MGATLCLLAWWAMDPPGLFGQVGTSNEYRQKAAILANLPKFVEWPAEAFGGEEAALQVCVYGSFHFGTSLAEAVRGQLVHRRRMDVRWVKKENELPGCHVLFLTGLDRGRLARALEAVRGGPTLTVGESEDFLKRGGMVNLVLESEQTHFDVSLESVAQGPLRISSKLLMLARHVLGSQGPSRPEPIT